MDRVSTTENRYGKVMGEKGWHSDESTRLPPMWPGFDLTCGLSLLLVLVPALRVFLLVLQFPSSTKTNISKFQFDLETVDRRATLWNLPKFPLIFF